MLEDFFSFLKNSPTSHHAKEEVEKRLLDKGYIKLDLKSSWDLEEDKGYFVTSGSFITAFYLPKTVNRISLVASHTDSPALKIKPNAVVEYKRVCKLNTDIYGGPIFSTWANRDLGIAGKVIYKKNGLQSCLVNIVDHPVMVCQPAIHIHRKINEEGMNAEHLKPVLSLNKDAKIEDLLKTQLDFDEIVDFDLFLYPLEQARTIGLDHSLISAYRLDNLASGYSSLIALLEAKHSDSLNVCIFFDHEEIGSQTYEGASFTLVDQILEKIIKDREKLFALKQDSLCLSCDLSHGFEPDYKEKFDKENTPHLDDGVVIKYDTKKNYVTSIEGAAIIQTIANENNIPLQKFHNKSNARSGSTIGPIFEASHGIKTVDIGISCLSMHATKEVISVKDFTEQTKLLKNFYEKTYNLANL